MAKEIKEEKEIVLCSANKSLTISHLGVQFRDGKFVTKDRKLANIILKYDSIFEM